MLEIGTLQELLFENVIISEDEFIEKYKKLHEEIKQRRSKS
jgi:hypothetical protein